MRAAVTSRMKFLTERLGEPDLVEILKTHKAAMSASRLAETPDKWVIMARSSLVDNFARKGVTPSENDVWVWSQWSGYLEDDSTKKMKSFFAPCRMEFIHSSGHASPDVLIRFAEALKPKQLLPVHGESWNYYSDSFPNLRIIPNEHWINL